MPSVLDPRSHVPESAGNFEFARCFLPLRGGGVTLGEAATSRTRRGRRTPERLENDMGGETILVADDEDNVREMIGTYLEEAGYRPVLVADGAEAMSEIHRRHPDL